MRSALLSLDALRNGREGGCGGRGLWSPSWRLSRQRAAWTSSRHHPGATSIGCGCVDVHEP